MTSSSATKDVSGLTARLAGLTVEEQVAALWTDDPHSGPTAQLNPGGNNPSDPSDVLGRLSRDLPNFPEPDSEAGKAFLASFKKAVLGPGGGGPAAVDYTIREPPCANVNVAQKQACPKRGSSLCGSCKLVQYCSKICQTQHWKIHKQDCKDQILAPDWEPIWSLEKRTPTFVSDEDIHGPRNPHSRGHALWGNVPAVDLFGCNHDSENQADTDFTVAAPASGDLRHIIQTVNHLPSNYNGKLTIVLNDRDPYVVARNLLLLILLALPDKSRGPDMALHFWYSVFVPMEYNSQMTLILLDFLADKLKPDETCQLSSTSTIAVHDCSDLITLITMLVRSTYQIGDAANELHRVRFAPSRLDLHHRQYCKLEPSHRLAFLEFRRFGLLLPFGACNAQFNYPNRFLFDYDGKFLLSDFASPLESWDIMSIMKTGIAHGSPRADIFGCLYFYVSDQLCEFARRLDRFHISFKLFNEDSGALAASIRSNSLSGLGLPSSTRFDRIAVSNIIDPSYMGLPKVLSDWGPLLSKEDPRATLLAYSLNWPMQHAGAKPGRDDTEKCMDVMQRLGKLPKPPNFATPSMLRAYAAKLVVIMSVLTAVHDNSQAFEEYLEVSGLRHALNKSQLRRKTTHTIVPPRLCVPIEAKRSALPEFPDDESWYFWTSVSGHSWTERFLEFSRR